MSLHDRLLKLNKQKLTEMLQEYSDNPFKCLTIKQVIQEKEIKENKKINLQHKHKIKNKQIEKKPKRYFTDEDFLDDIMIEKDSDNNDEIEINEKKKEEMRKDSINNRTVSRLDADIVIKRINKVNKNKPAEPKQILSPFSTSFNSTSTVPWCDN